MRTLRLLVLPWITLLFLAGCSKDGGDQPPTTTTTEVTPAKSKQDVTVCITAQTPDIMQARVKADGSQRVCWKGHGAAYDIYFKTADWPFEETAPGSTADYMIIHVESMKASELYTLKERLSLGEESKHPYEVRDPANPSMAPPGGPEIIGEG
jgi:hypothetical protein